MGSSAYFINFAFPNAPSWILMIMTNRKIRSILLLAALWFASCTPKQQSNDTIYVSILPLRGLIYNIIGDDFPIEVLVPAGASPETFEPTPQQFIALNRAQLIFSVGLLDFETTLLDKIENRENIIRLNQGIEPITGTCSHATHHHHTHGVDPHIWTSPKALQRMAANAYEVIHRIYPDSGRYETNYRKLRAELIELDERIAQQIETSGVEVFIIYHPALTYYARDYGLQQIAIEDDGKEPSARHLARLIQLARAQKVRNIFYQSQFPASTVEVIANDIGAEVVQIDPLREDIVANIEEVTRLITAR